MINDKWKLAADPVSVVGAGVCGSPSLAWFCFRTLAVNFVSDLLWEQTSFQVSVVYFLTVWEQKSFQVPGVYIFSESENRPVFKCLLYISSQSVGERSRAYRCRIWEGSETRLFLRVPLIHSKKKKKKKKRSSAWQGMSSWRNCIP